MVKTGHPAFAGENEKPPRFSSAIIPNHDITQNGFHGHVYYDDGIVVASPVRTNLVFGSDSRHSGCT
jgi:hypothetical protein